MSSVSDGILSPTDLEPERLMSSCPGGGDEENFMDTYGGATTTTAITTAASTEESALKSGWGEKKGRYVNSCFLFLEIA